MTSKCSRICGQYSMVRNLEVSRSRTYFICFCSFAELNCQLERRILNKTRIKISKTSLYSNSLKLMKKTNSLCLLVDKRRSLLTSKIFTSTEWVSKAKRHLNRSLKQSSFTRFLKRQKRWLKTTERRSKVTK